MEEQEKQFVRLRVNIKGLITALGKQMTPVVMIGFESALSSLETIAEEARRIKNQKILEELYYIGAIELTEEEKKEFNIKR